MWPNSRDPEADTPTKVWPLHAGCTLSPVQQKEFTARSGKHSNLAIALATRHVHERMLVRLDLRCSVEASQHQVE